MYLLFNVKVCQNSSSKLIWLLMDEKYIEKCIMLSIAILRYHIFRIFCQVFHLLLIFRWYFPSMVLRITRSDAQYEIGTDSIKMFSYKGRMWRKKWFSKFKTSNHSCTWLGLLYSLYSHNLIRVSLLIYVWTL